MATEKQTWGSTLGFILAASGSAIGLGNIVFFSANSYKYGAGAFYLPYLIALVVIGIPLMIMEFGLGRQFGKAFPLAMGEAGGRFGEWAGWWGIINALLITMYYVTILGWTAGMWWLAIAGSLWEPSVAVEAFGFAQGALPNPIASFFDLISGWGNVFFVALVWGLNIALLLQGTKSIEAGVKIMMPLIWLFMIALVVRGVTLDGGMHGVYLLMTPNFSALADPVAWQGAFSQIFFTLSLGFGIMTTYASYLPKKSDLVSNSVVVSCLNCSFEMIAGLAIFSLLFAFALTPKASTLAMMFFIVPGGIAKLPFAVSLVGALFFTLLLLAGLSSSISLVESVGAAIIQKYGVSRRWTLVLIALVGMVGSLAFALPTVIDKGLDSNGTLGLTLLDLVDHYTFSYGLILVGLVECLVVGWMLPVSKLREVVNAHSRLPLGAWFDVLIKFIMPALLITILVLSVGGELGLFDGGAWARQGCVDKGALPLYGCDYVMGNEEAGDWSALPLICFLFWLVATSAGAAVLAFLKGNPDATPDATEVTP